MYLFSVVPTRVGVDRSANKDAKQSAGSPHACGGRP